MNFRVTAQIAHACSRLIEAHPKAAAAASHELARIFEREDARNARDLVLSQRANRRLQRDLDKRRAQDQRRAAHAVAKAR